MTDRKDDGSFKDDDPHALVVDIVILLTIVGILYMLMEFGV